MILKKIITGLFLLFFLNGCVQSTALLGPAYTLASTGNIYHAGLSYGVLIKQLKILQVRHLQKILKVL